MKIANREIGGDNPPYIIAEISGNHGGKIENAIRLIVAAKKAGADAVKTQCYEPGTITLDCSRLGFIVQSGLWQGRTLYDLYKSAHTPFAWHDELYACARENGIAIFSSVFDRSSVDYLEKMGCPAYKIASFEIVDTPLISYAAKTGKPLIISTGMASDREIEAANEAAGGAAFLHCTSEYPGTIGHSDIGRVSRIRNLLGPLYPVGISDHTISPVVVPVAATAIGCSIIEKHLKLDDVPSEDDTFSLPPEDFRLMVETVGVTHAAMMPQPYNAPNKQFRRSLYAIKDIAVGEEFSEENIRSIRPGYGLHPGQLPKLLGKKATRSFRRGDPLK